ncbi:C-type lectin domain family 4 member A-like [Callospermophilus lateralis]|uniref:C-type lectin domain family 4 member A-like n=1 Tax=Callospermophilus lateralis TaxID=76772 RepID=UPI0040385121
MALESTHMEMRLKNKPKSSVTNSNSPAVFIFHKEFYLKKYSQILEEKKYPNFTKEPIHPELKCSRHYSTMKGKVWSCCPKNWKSFSSSCYFISTDSKSWNKSEENCSRMEAHLLVINSKEEQDFIIPNLQIDAVYDVGLSDPECQRHWQWVHGTPYNPSAL